MNWTQLLIDLKSARLSQTQIAEFCGCGQTTISDLYAGKIKNPSYPIGLSLIALSKKYKRKINRLTGTDDCVIAKIQVVQA